MSEKFKRILVPLDGSRLAESVLPLTVVIAQTLGAKIILLHIIEEHAPQTIHGEQHLTAPQQAENYLTEIIERYADRVPMEHHVHGTEEHNVAQSIATHTDELEADMIALCTHGRSGLRRAVSGSIAQQVLKRVSEPVLIVRPRTETPSAIRRIMVPLDGTPTSEPALDAASEIARAAKAMLNLVVVVPTPGTVTGDLLPAARLIPNSTRAALNVEVEQSRDYLEDTTKRLEAESVETNAAVMRGETIQTLADAAESTATDLIVIATHGRTGLDAAFTGSVAAGLIGRVTQPVLMIKI